MIKPTDISQPIRPISPTILPKAVRIATVLRAAILITSGTTPLMAQNYNFSKNTGTESWELASNWDLASVPNGPDITANFGPTASGGATAKMNSTVELGHLVVNVSSGNWNIGGGGGLRFVNSDATNPSITLKNTAANQTLVIAANLLNPSSGNPKMLEIYESGGIGGGVITLSGDNSGFTGGFHINSTVSLTLGFLYENSLGNNVIRVSNAAQNVRLGQGAVNRTFTNDFVVDSGASLSIYSNALASGGIVLDGTIKGSGAVNFWTYGGGSIELKSRNTYAGDTVIASGLNLIFNSNENFGTGGKITFAASGGSPTLTYADGNSDDLTKKADGSVRQVSFQTANVTINTAANDVTFANAITSAETGTSGLIKEGTGTLRLLANNTYGLLTTVSKGSLLVNNISGSGTGKSAVTVMANATLGGIGAMRPTGDRGILFRKGSVLSPGDSLVANGVGTITIDLTNTIGTLQFEDLSSISFDLGAGLSSDLISLTSSRANSVNFLGNTVINLFDHSNGKLSEGDYLLFTAADSNVYSGLTRDGNLITGGLTVGQVIDGYQSILWLDEGNIVLKLQAIPEPGALGLIGGGCLLFIFLCRRPVRA